MMERGMERRLEEAGSLRDIFGLVQEAVWESLGKRRAGLRLGLAELGFTMQGFVGGFYPVHSDLIVMNKTVFRKILEAGDGMARPYAFTVLLHEYLHSLGLMSEMQTRAIAYAVCRDMFGDNSMVTEMALDLSQFLPEILKPGMEIQPLDGHDKRFNWKPL